ncbi:ROK family protein [Kutzneria sp. NPDC052558]|uniref:ROK family transcriptional regulator n=1 Tax=Kutzneria sp. NPDC052558 TaxID=3364121 RepID=UPI0037CCA319
MLRRPANTTDLGRWNAETVLERLYDREARTNTELVRETGLSRSTVERALDLVVAQGVVRRSEPVALASGRPAVLYQLHAEYGYQLAIDVGAHTIRARVDDLAGPSDLGPGPGEAEPETVDPTDSADARLAAMERVADRALAGAGITREQVRAVTVGTPGIVDRDGRITLCWVVRAGDWVGDRLLVRVRDRFPTAVVSVDNDANLGVLAEQRYGVAGDTEDVVVVLAGRRVGFGIVHGGVLHRGAHNQAGESANIRDSRWGQANDWLRRHQDRAPKLFEAAGAGDADAVAEVGELAELLGRAFAEIVHTIDPRLIVLGGAISLAGEVILAPLAERFGLACRGMEEPSLLLSTLGSRAVLLGAAEHARRRAFDHLLDDVRPLLPNATPRRRS